MEKLPPHLKEIMFMFNHDLLPTWERLKKTNQINDETCQECGAMTESSLRVFVQCTKRDGIVKWISKELIKIGHLKKMEETL